MRIGILGAGQLGSMLVAAGDPLGLEFRFFSPSAAVPGARLAPLTVGDYADRDALIKFAQEVDLITYEFENVPGDSVRALESVRPVYPPAAALETSQDRLSEKQLFRKLGIQTADFASVDSIEDCERAAQSLHLPMVLKTRRFGYDGKGQQVIRSLEQIPAAVAALGGRELIAEQFIPFDTEVSIIAARQAPIPGVNSRDIRFYPLVENRHAEGILRETRAPARSLTPELQLLAECAATEVLEALDYSGVLAIEFFVVGDALCANEMAPRVHNSGHWTIEGAVVSQFENHLRAILGLPLGCTDTRGFVGMLNLIGDAPDPVSSVGQRLLESEDTHLHLYHKKSAPGRKVGHITFVSDSESARERQLALLQSFLTTTA